MYINFVTQYSREAKKVKMNRHFKYLIILGFMANFWDVLSAVTISYYQSIPVWANMIINSVYFIFGSAFAYSFVSYVEKTVLKSVNKFFHMFNLCVFVIYEISIVIGIFFGYYVWFDKVLGYQHGPLYLLLFSMPLYFSFCSAVYIFAQRAQMNRRKLVATASYLVISFAGILMQVLCFTDVLLSGFGGALALFIVFFSIETPDYHKLVATMEELEESRRVAEEERTRADIANQAKSKFLAKMSHEIRTPINTIIGMNEMVIRESTEDEVLKNTLSSAIDAAMGRAHLTDREINILKLRFGLNGTKPRTQNEIAGMLGISRSYVSRIETKAINKLSEVIKE